jgi:peroxiredoxin
VKVVILFFQMLLLTSVSLPIQQSSDKTVRSGSIGVGEVAPDFTLVDENNKKVTLSDARGKSPVVLVFYRGYW